MILDPYGLTCPQSDSNRHCTDFKSLKVDPGTLSWTLLFVSLQRFSSMSGQDDARTTVPTCDTLVTPNHRRTSASGRARSTADDDGVEWTIAPGRHDALCGLVTSMKVLPTRHCIPRASSHPTDTHLSNRISEDPVMRGEKIGWFNVQVSDSKKRTRHSSLASSMGCGVRLVD